MVNLFPHFTSLAMMERTNERASIDYVHQFDNGVSSGRGGYGYGGGGGGADAFPVDDSYAALPAAPSRNKKGGRGGGGGKNPKNAWRVKGGRKVYHDENGKQSTGAPAFKKYQKAKDNGTLQQQQPRRNQAGPLQAKKGRKRK